MHVHVERLSGRRAQRDELHGRHDVFPSSDDKALALSQGVGTGIAEDCFTSSISLTVNAFHSGDSIGLMSGKITSKFCNVHSLASLSEYTSSLQWTGRAEGWRYGTPALDVDGSLCHYANLEIQKSP